ncbi:MAG: T9SS type A sorting domain-containing protein, partial [Gemmatimonadota bacterium]|nr:T9SS type A sorting domain-containing protein [Gemmatimonadota bacterium]
MKAAIGCLIGLVFGISASAEPLLEGRVRLDSGTPAVGAQVLLFDLTDLRRGAIARAMTDGTGYFALPLAALTGRALPARFALGPNYPNPFNPSTIISYQLAASSQVRLEVFNLLGQRIATLVDGERPAGFHTATWHAVDGAGRAVGAGVYIYRMTVGEERQTGRMVLIDGQAGIPAAGAAGPLLASAWERVEVDAGVYGLTVAGAGLVAYVDPAFWVGVDEVGIVVEEYSGIPRMKLVAGGILGDVNNDGQVDEFDVLYVALYSKDPSITLPNNGDISLGDVNGDGTVDLADALVLALYKVNPSDPTLPPGIGQPVDGGGDDHGDTPSSATALAVGSSQSGQIEPGGDVDYFRVQVSGSGELTVQTTGRLDTKGQLEDSAGAVLARNDDGGDGSNFRIAHAVSAGTYYIKVEGYDASTTGGYTIHASGPGGGSSPDLIVASASVSDNTLT